MRTANIPHFPIGNRLLASFPAEELVHLLPHLETVALQQQEVLYEADQPIPHIYFPRSGVISLLIKLQGGFMVEVAMVGREGMLGFPALLGGDCPHTTALSTIPGEADRILASRLREVARRSEPVQDLLLRHAEAVFSQTAQLAACNRLHSMLERCARWLLMVDDRLASQPFYLTQQFFARLQGVLRATVNRVFRAFQSQGLIRYSRGRMTILDRSGLEALACACYGIIRADYERVLG